MITTDQKDVLNQYAYIKSEIKQLESKADELNPQVLEIMQGNEVEEIELSGIGKLSLGSRRTYKYSDKVKELDAQLKDQKKLEERTVAEYDEKFYTVFKTQKDA